MNRLGENGFTIQELGAVGLLLILLIVPSLFLTHPKNYDIQERQAERRVAVADVMEKIHAYVAQTGSLPSDILTKMQPIGSAVNQVDLCKDLAPKYVTALPSDPFFGETVHCSAEGAYETGIGIQKTGKGTQVTIAALGSEGKLIYLTD